MTTEHIKRFWKGLCVSPMGCPEVEILTLEKAVADSDLPGDLRGQVLKLTGGNVMCPDVSLGSVHDVLVSYLVSQVKEDLPPESKWVLGYLSLWEKTTLLSLQIEWSCHQGVWLTEESEQDITAAVDLLVEQGKVSLQDNTAFLA